MELREVLAVRGQRALVDRAAIDVVKQLSRQPGFGEPAGVGDGGRSEAERSHGAPILQGAA